MKETETREICAECGREFLMQHLCIECQQKKDLITKNSILRVSDKIKLISLKDIKDGDLIVLQQNNEPIDYINDIAVYDTSTEKAIEEITNKICEITQKKVIFIMMSPGMTINHIPEVQLKQIGLAKIKKENKGNADIW